MTISARLQITPAADRRGWARRRLSLVSSLQATGEDVTIHDVSSTGLLIETTAELAVLDDLEIELPEAGVTRALVIWSSGRYFGCQFKDRLSQAAISAALLRSPPARPGNMVSPREPGVAKPSRDAITVEDPGAAGITEDGKASLGTRLRVILGSALLLWALLIWAAVSLYGMVRGG